MIVFLAGIDSVTPKVGCQVIAGILQYFMLSAFIWMAIIAINLYQLIMLVFRRNDTKFFQSANILGWGMEMLIHLSVCVRVRVRVRVFVRVRVHVRVRVRVHARVCV